VSAPITRNGRIIRIVIGLVFFLLNGISLGNRLEPVFGWTISGAVWMTAGLALSLYISTTRSG
jgi:hypothetical protein